MSTSVSTPVVDLFSKKECWTTLWYAKDANGDNVWNRYSDENKAVCWCLVGAIDKLYPSEDRQGVWKRLQAVINTRHPGKYCDPENPTNDDSVLVAKFNDTEGYEEVLEVCKLAQV